MQGFYGRDLPEDFGLQHAGEYLASHFGASYKYIWGLGLLAAGQASTMSGTYTGKVAPMLPNVGRACSKTQQQPTLYEHANDALDDNLVQHAQYSP